MLEILDHMLFFPGSGPVKKVAADTVGIMLHAYLYAASSACAFGFLYQENTYAACHRNCKRSKKQTYAKKSEKPFKNSVLTRIGVSAHSGKSCQKPEVWPLLCDATLRMTQNAKGKQHAKNVETENSDRCRARVLFAIDN